MLASGMPVFAFAAESTAILVTGATGQTARYPIGDDGFAAVDWEGNRALIDAAKAAGVRHFILLSAGSAGRDGFPYSWSISPYPWKAKSKASLRSSTVPYPIIAVDGVGDEPGRSKRGPIGAALDDYRGQRRGAGGGRMAQGFHAIAGRPSAPARRRLSCFVCRGTRMNPRASDDDRVTQNR
jgi:hypothetical protein